MNLTESWTRQQKRDLLLAGTPDSTCQEPQRQPHARGGKDTSQETDTPTHDPKQMIQIMRETERVIFLPNHPYSWVREVQEFPLPFILTIRTATEAKESPEIDQGCCCRK